MALQKGRKRGRKREREERTCILKIMESGTSSRTMSASDLRRGPVRLVPLSWHAHHGLLPSFSHTGASAFVNVLTVNLLPGTDLSFPKAL